MTVGKASTSIRLYSLALFFLTLCFNVFLPGASAQTSAEEAYRAERQNAVQLFKQQKHLEALPLFEDLATQNPKDHEVLLGLAVCLVDHAATLNDAEAAVKERVRARGLLLKAQELGNHSDLLQNLLQILPENGQVQFSKSPAVDEAMRAGEAAFAKRDYPQAIQEYSKALELDPKNASAALFVGDSYFAAKDYLNAPVWYERASQIEPNSETPYRYYADMLIKSGEMAKARTMAIRAVVAEPYNPIPWRQLQQWAAANHVQLIPIHITIPGSVSQKSDKTITITIDPNTSDAGPAWAAYSMERALWLGDKFKKNFPPGMEYRHSLLEESDALATAAKVWTEINDKKKPPVVPKDPNLALLLRLYQAQMIEPYVLLSGADDGIAQDYSDYREKSRTKLEEYLSQFVVPPAPAKQ